MKGSDGGSMSVQCELAVAISNQFQFSERAYCVRYCSPPRYFLKIEVVNCRDPHYIQE